MGRSSGGLVIRLYWKRRPRIDANYQIFVRTQGEKLSLSTIDTF